MRAYLVLVAVVGAILVGEASAADISPYPNREIAMKFGVPGDYVVEALNSKLTKPYDQGRMLEGAEGKDVEVCNGQTITDILKMTEIFLKDCNKASMIERVKHCEKFIADDTNLACRNARAFCRDNVERAAKYCNKRKEIIEEEGLGDALFVSNLEYAVVQNYVNHGFGNWIFTPGPQMLTLEKFIVQ